MPWIAFFALVLWLPVVVVIFERYTVTKAIVFAFVTAWLFLPPTMIALPGFPDWSKTTATVVSASLCLWLKQPQSVFAFRPRWYDIPIIIYCGCPILSSLSVGVGAYDGVSAILEESMRWGLPYFIGRIYLGSASGNRQLCLGLAVGGMIYMPLCLWEIRMSPQLKSQVYGFGGGRAVDLGLRYGGYRPMVFLAHGLEVGWWMCCASFAAYMLWRSGTVKRLFGYPMSTLTIGLTFVTVACKSTGALIQILLGFALIHICRSTKSTVLVSALVLIGPIYCVARPLGIMSGEQLVSYVNSTLGPERAESIEYRFRNEEILMLRARQRPIFGWAREAFNPVGKDGKTAAVTDGLWIIVFGTMGSVGLISFNAMMLLPTVLFLQRYRPRTWFDPEVAPVVCLAMILPLYMMDNLSNAMLNPIYAIAMGSVTGFVSQSLRSRNREEDQPVDQTWNLQNSSNAMHTMPVMSGRSPHEVVADEFELNASIAYDRGQIRQADDLYQRAIISRRASWQSLEETDQLDRLAQTHVRYARLLARSNQVDAAIIEREEALHIWRTIREDDSAALIDFDLYAANLNDLAWSLINIEPLEEASLDRAILLVEEAVQLAAGHAPYWNTLGIARYRRGDYHKAIYSLSQAVRSSPDGGNAFDYYYLALANHKLGYPKPSQDWADRGNSWLRRHPELTGLLDPIRLETIETIDAT